MIERKSDAIGVFQVEVVGDDVAGQQTATPIGEGSCTPVNFTQFREAVAKGQYSGHIFEPVFQPGVNYCRSVGDTKGSLNTVEAQGSSLDEFFNIFFGVMDRPVVNQTGIAGLFNLHLEYAPGAPSGGAAGGPSIFTALEQQLGLKLEPTTESRDSLVIDRVEKPTAN